MKSVPIYHQLSDTGLGTGSLPNVPGHFWDPSRKANFHVIDDNAISEPMLDAGVRAKLNSGGAGGNIPIGGIIMWSGNIASIPRPTWALCDGVENAPGPDLRNSFVVGAAVDDGGVAKTDIEGTLKVTGGVTGHSHSSHAPLTHSGMSIGDHTGLTHSLAIADHPDLTHIALNAPSHSFDLPDFVFPSFTGSHEDREVRSAAGHRPRLLTARPREVRDGGQVRRGVEGGRT
jgi:hypothetical protein